MKPIKIVMSAFGSYGQEETVSFEGVDYGIFLISGDTGSGKTTIFDAITYALYDKTSGGKREGEMMRSQYAKDDRLTFVSFSFRCKGEVYTVNRFPKQFRRSKRKNKEGEYTLTAEGPKVELILPDGSVFKGKKPETDKKIIEIIGLDVDQFTQMVMIAQGDFLELLQAKSQERKKIFSKIFNTRIYSRISEELKNRAEELCGEVEDRRKFCVQEMEAVICESDSQYYEKWQELDHFSQVRGEEILTVLTGIIEEIKEQERQLEARVLRKQQELDAQKRQLEQGKETNRLFENLKKCQEEKAQLEEQLPAMEEKKGQIVLGRKALLVEREEEKYLLRKKNRAVLKEDIEKLEKELEANKALLENLAAAKRQATQEKEERLPKLHGQLQRIQDGMGTLKQLKEVETRYQQFVEQVEKGNHILEEKKREVQKVKEERGNLKKAIEEQSQVEEQLLVLRQKKEKEEATHEIYAQLVAKIQEIHKGQKEEAAQKISFQEAVLQYEEKSRRYEEKSALFFKEQAGILAKELQEGEPCMVCGSIHHPHKASITSEEVTQAQVEEEKAIREDAQKKREQMHTRYQEAVRQLERMIAEYEGLGSQLSQEAFSYEQYSEPVLLQEQKLQLEKLEQLRHAYKQKEQEKEAWNKRKTKEAQLEKLEEELAVQLEDIREKLQRVQLNKEGKFTELQTLKEATSYTSIEEAAEEERRVKEAIGHLEAQVRQVDARYEQEQQKDATTQGICTEKQAAFVEEGKQEVLCQEAFAQQLKAQDFQTMEAYQEAKTSAEQIAMWEAQRDAFEQQYTLLQGRLDTLSEQTKGKNVVEVSAYDTQVQALTEEIQILQQQVKTIYSKEKRNGEAKEKITRILGELNQYTKDYEMINVLNKTANGKLKSAKGLDFETYIQRRYFKEMIYEANKRLIKMTSNQFILQCRDLEDLGNQGNVGLDLDVYSLVTDKIRDVKTLSGGESFMAALSMALGMSDVIQNTVGKIHLETMFIDEGFGSLDDEARNQAVKILNELAGKKRLVGIISHVTELKEQMEQRLMIRKDENGSHAKWELE